jgi:hypothetical protein
MLSRNANVSLTGMAKSMRTRASHEVRPTIETIKQQQAKAAGQKSLRQRTRLHSRFPRSNVSVTHLVKLDRLRARARQVTGTVRGFRGVHAQQSCRRARAHSDDRPCTAGRMVGVACNLMARCRPVQHTRDQSCALCWFPACAKRGSWRASIRISRHGGDVGRQRARKFRAIVEALRDETRVQVCWAPVGRSFRSALILQALLLLS